MSWILHRDRNTSQKPSDDWCKSVLDVSFIWIELQTSVHIHEHLMYRISF